MQNEKQETEDHEDNLVFPALAELGDLEMTYEAEPVPGLGDLFDRAKKAYGFDEEEEEEGF